MKKFKKCIALLLAAVMVMGIAFTTSAQTIDTGKGGDGSITIANAYKGETYTVYKIFDVTYTETTETDEEGNKTTSYIVSYTTTENIVDAMQSLTDENGDEITCPFVFTTNDGETYYVTVGTYYNNETDEYVEYDENYILEFLAAYVATLDEDNVYCSEIADDTGSLVFENVEYEYYYITTTTGTLVTVDTITPDVTVEDKNTTPSSEKTVKGEQENDESDDQSSATVGDVQTFKIEITVGDGAYNYVLHDIMSDGLELDLTSIEVYVDGEKVDDTNYTIYTADSRDSDGANVITDDCTFEIAFSNDWISELSSGTVITITYTATVTDDALEEGEVTNKEYVSFGDSSSEPGDTTTTYLYSFKINKVNSSSESLSGAEFVLYTSYDKDSGEYGSPLYFIYDSETKTYTVVIYDEDDEDFAGSTTINAGNVTIDGLGAGNYYLVETKAPDGYNLLEDAIVITIIEGENGGYTIKVGDGETTSDTTVSVVNYTGSELPSTGGMGRTILYAIGIVLILGAGIVLVVRRRARAN